MDKAWVSRGGDAAVQSTNDDAQLSKLSCVRLGYFEDQFVHLFVRRPVRRPPLINRGYYSRYAALRTLLFQFLAAGSGGGEQPPPHKQVLCLGAGYDTSYFELARQGIAGEGLTYVEVDFEAVTRRKATAIARTPELLQCLEAGAGASGAAPAEVQVDAEGGRVTSARYRLLPADLRHLDALEVAFAASGLDPQVPTFVLAECVVVYMPPQQGTDLIGWLGERLPTAVLAVYEQINAADAFGRQMMVNLEARGCPLLGIQPSVQAQAARLTQHGWQRAECRDMAQVYSQCIDPQDRQRVERLELFDEFEEWNLIQQHYCIAVGVNDATGVLKDFGWPVWGSKPA